MALGPVAKILVVGDEAAESPDIGRRLEELGYTAIEGGSSATRALEVAAQTAPDLVLVAMGLPSGDSGIETASKIRAVLELPMVIHSARRAAESPARACGIDSPDQVLVSRDDLELKGKIEVALQEARRERDLGRRDRLLSAILEGIGDGVVATGPLGRVLFLNSKARSLIGWEPERATRPLDSLVQFRDESDGRLLDFLWPWQHEEPDLPAGPACLATEDGRAIHVELGCSAIDLGAESGTGYLFVLRDVEARVRMERAAMEEKRLFAAGPTVIFKWKNEPGWPVEYVSSNVEAVLGHTREELLAPGMTYARILHADDLRRVEAELAEHAAAGRDVFAQEYRILHRDGRYRWVHDQQTVVRDSLGAIIGYHGYVLDITDRKDAERALIEAKARAEAQARRLDEQAKELRFAKDAALAASRAKSVFVANTSHEIRTPISGVVGMVNLLLETELSSDQREYAEIIRSSGQALLGIVNDILDLAKLESGHMKLESMDFELRVVAEDAVDLILPQARAKRLEVTMAVQKDVPIRLRGDPTKLRQILVNLLGNAVKFTLAGEVNLRIRSAGCTPDGARIRFEVRDTGTGIPEAYRSRLFQPFVQGAESTSRHFGGTGLGLAICRRFVEMMGGSIDLESEEGKGSTFGFTIELAAATSAGEDEAAWRGLREKRLLLVVQNATSRSDLRAQLEGWGAECVAAESPGAGLRLLREGVKERMAFDAVLVDRYLPDLDGYRFADAVKEDPLIAGTRLFLLTTGALDRTQAKARGFEAEFAKPVRSCTLRHTIASVLLSHPAFQDEAAIAGLDCRCGSCGPGSTASERHKR